MDGDGLVDQRPAYHHLISVLEEAGLSTILLDRNHAILAFSSSAATLFGLFSGCERTPIRQFEQSPVMVNLAEDLAYLAAGRRIVEREFCDPVQRWFSRRIYMRTADGSDEVVVITLRDISNQKRGQIRAERELANRNSLAETLPDIVSRMDLERRRLFISPGITEIIDLPLEASRGKTNQELGFSAELCDLWDQTVSSVLRTGRPHQAEFKIVDRYGRERWFDDRLIPERDASGHVVSVLSIARDITDLVEAREALERALNEQETLLADVHHRVKNNLFLVIGLLSLEKQRLTAAEFTADDMITSFDKVIARIHVISTIYTHLYENSEGSQHLSTAMYLGELIRLVQVSERGRSVTVQSDIDDVPIPPHQALPLGLIVNESLSNVYKHAFPDGRAGRVYVALKRAAAGGLTVTIADDGVGMKAHQNGHSVGTKLVESLVSQLQAVVTEEPQSPFSVGTVFRFTFDPNGEA